MIHFSLKLKAGAQSKQASTYSSNPKFKAKETYYLNTETHPASLLSLDLEDLKSEIGGKGAGLFEMPALVETLKIVLAQPQKFTKRYPRTVQIISKLNDPQAFIKRLIENPPYVESFTIPTWQANRLENGKMKTALQNLIYEDIATMEKRTGKKFGDSDRPLLVSARSGARRSMPGMMDTILNVGLNSQLVKELAQKNPEMARF
jgi:phosphoenolpyruvate synthase/pyruvate phosphate dikinase